MEKKKTDAGRDWGQEEKGMTEDEMVGWHHPLNGHEFEQVPGDGEGQGRLVCCSPWPHPAPHLALLPLEYLPTLSRVKGPADDIQFSEQKFQWVSIMDY